MNLLGHLNFGSGGEEFYLAFMKVMVGAIGLIVISWVLTGFHSAGRTVWHRGRTDLPPARKTGFRGFLRDAMGPICAIATLVGLTFFPFLGDHAYPWRLVLIAVLANYASRMILRNAVDDDNAILAKQSIGLGLLLNWVSGTVAIGGIVWSILISMGWVAPPGFYGPVDQPLNLIHAGLQEAARKLASSKYLVPIALTAGVIALFAWLANKMKNGALGGLAVGLTLMLLCIAWCSGYMTASEPAVAKTHETHERTTVVTQPVVVNQGDAAIVRWKVECEHTTSVRGRKNLGCPEAGH